uniref:Uncharacterized protein n=1 Tax=Parascaris equorum TaxID=6256 RepID=A0A914RH98_PAREQ
MADSASIRLSPGQEPYMQADRLQLRSYFPHEIDELSVVQITQTKTFDEWPISSVTIFMNRFPKFIQIGHPVRGDSSTDTQFKLPLSVDIKRFAHLR